LADHAVVPRFRGWRAARAQLTATCAFAPLAQGPTVLRQAGRSLMRAHHAATRG
jgi:hypothetical protein